MNSLLLECFSGISGDMFVGAMLDLGVPFSRLQETLNKLPACSDINISHEKKSKLGISGTKFDVHLHNHHGHKNQDHHGHTHEDHHHGQSWREIKSMLENHLDDALVLSAALGIFEKVAEAEARIHGVDVAEVHFHEVGAWDSIADIVCAAVCIRELGITSARVSRLAEGTGFVQCQHGRYPLPVPATLEILQGFPIEQEPVPHELITPTGAAILAHLCGNQAQGSSANVFSTSKIGYGLGARDLDDRPNLLRARLSGTSQTHHYASDEVVLLTANFDDMSGEAVGSLMEKLMFEGALDVIAIPSTMKKGRSGIQLQVMTDDSSQAGILDILFKDSSTFGVRVQKVSRKILERDFVEVRIVGHPIAVKRGFIDGKPVKFHPEYEDCAAAAAASGKPLSTIQHESISLASTLSP